MLALIKHARANGLVPVVAGNYSRNDYMAIEYGYVQRLNGWAMPTINLLGAVDDLSGSGRYTPGYWFDALHPTISATPKWPAPARASPCATRPPLRRMKPNQVYPFVAEMAALM
jgi:hypothetical protein